MKDWQKEAQKCLVGKTIKHVQWMTNANAKEIGWSNRPLLIVFDDDSIMFAQSDDEGNDGGALYVDKGKDEQYIFPVFHREEE